jgi:glycosyltransferase involved in cell wall biosynthesis
MHVVLIEFRQSTPYPVQLANALGQLCQVTLMLPEKATQFAKYVDRERVNLQRFHMPKLRHPANLALVWRLKRQIRNLRPHLVHITYWHLWCTSGLGIFATTPLVATVHDVNRHPGERGVWAIPSLIYRLQWRWADQVIVHGESSRQRLMEQYGRQSETINVLPIGTYDFYRDMTHTNQPEKPNTVLFFGRIWGYKGLEYLIEAEPMITRAVPDVRIIIAGEGDDFTKYEQAMVNRNQFEVHNYRIPDEKVAELFQSASVVVLPYTEASQSGVIPVAYAFGKPVIATKVGGIPDVVDHGQTGYLVPPRDSVSLAEAVISLLKDRQTRLEMGYKVTEKAENEMSWARIAERTLHVYEKTLTSAKDKPTNRYF